MKKLFLFFALVSSVTAAMGQTEVSLTTTQAKNYYKATSKKTVSVHDPSVVWEPASKRYYIFGTHTGCAYSTDLQNWTPFQETWKANGATTTNLGEVFVTPAVKTVMKGGVAKDLPQFNAMAWSDHTAANILGNLWAPDVIWNPVMQKWCQYLSVNGDAWHSSIVLLTSDHIEGPYEYQAPVVISGFYDGSHSYKNTDLELVLGKQLSSLPSRYASPWASTRKSSFPNNIDPCVFYDEEGQLRMCYGSWSGGIFMLKLNPETGLRDYDVTYAESNTSDPYFGKKIAGGYYSSGEAPYIEYVNGWYYLFVSYGGLESGGYSTDNRALGGYVMRVFRSKNPDGPFADANGISAIYDSYKMNYGKSSDNRGVKIIGAYADWGFMGKGELAQGHNSLIAAEDGRTYLVYHTRFDDGSEGHLVRVHQLFQTQDGWLVASPFEYNGEQLTDTLLAKEQLVADAEIAGTYSLLVHKYDIDYANRETVKPVKVTLTADGKVKGAYTGSWSTEPGTSYLNITLGNTLYKGVIFEQQMDGQSIKSISFSALANSGVNIWGHKYRGDYSIAWQLNNSSIPVSNNESVRTNIDLSAMAPVTDNVAVTWTSDNKEVISDHGRYYPLGLAEDTKVKLTGRITAGNYFWEKTYTVTAKSEENSKTTVDWQTGMTAHYTFDAADGLKNRLADTETAQLSHNGSNRNPVIESGDVLRNGGFAHLSFGAAANESYVAIPNPLKGKELENGATISFFVKRTDNNVWDALFGTKDNGQNFYLTGNLYLGFNQGKATENSWIDINHPNAVTNGTLTPGHWHMVTVTVSRSVTSTTGGIFFYVDGVKQTNDKYNGMLTGNSFSTRQAFDYNLIVNLLSQAPELYLGNGSFWGSPDALFDDVTVHERALSATEVKGMYQMMNRADVAGVVEGIEAPAVGSQSQTSDCYYDLSGRRVTTLKPGLYIKNGKKIFIR